MKKIIALLPAKYSGKRYDIEVADTHNYFADGLLVHNCSIPKDLTKDNAIAKWDWDNGIHSQIKADGMFANVAHSTESEVTIESRNGSPFPLEYFKDLIEEVRKYIPVGMQLHGELLVKRNGAIMPRAEGNGIFNSILQGGEFEPGDVAVYHVWDMIPLGQAKAKNKYKEKYSVRFLALYRALDALVARDENSVMSLIEYKIVYSLQEAYAHCKSVMLRGLEGTVIKRMDMFWEDTTSIACVKLKLQFSVELKVVGFNPAAFKSKNADTFGSMQCESEDGLLKVGVTGLKDDIRKNFWDNRENMLGGIVEVVANGIMSPSETDGYHSLFLPRFSCTRLDKKVADTLPRIFAIQQAAIDMADVIEKV